MGTTYGTPSYTSSANHTWRAYCTYPDSGTGTATVGIQVTLPGSTTGHLFIDTVAYIDGTEVGTFRNTYYDVPATVGIGSLSVGPGSHSFKVTFRNSGYNINGDSSGTFSVATPVSKPSYNSTSAGSITGTSVVLTASINNGGATITAGGWQLSTDGGSNWTTYSGDWASKTITGLSNSTTYTYRGYATNSAGTTYSSTSTFTTLGPPTYGSAPYTGTIFYNYVELKVDTIQTHGSALTAGGWQLSTDGGSTWTTYAAAMTSTDSPYKKYIYNLSPATGYWYRSYATNSVGTGYSSVGYVTTNAAPPTLASPSITNITATSAELSITCTDTGGKPLTSSNIKVYTTSPFALVTTINGLSGTATGLSPNTEYRAEANASNADNSTSYGMGTFTTLAPSSNVKVSLNGAAFVTGTVKLSQNGGAFVTIPGSKVKTSINGGSF